MAMMRACITKSLEATYRDNKSNKVIITYISVICKICVTYTYIHTIDIFIEIDKWQPMYILADTES